jgi:indolepyruvate ferredoxin oxidoreductase, beta subunit
MLHVLGGLKFWRLKPHPAPRPGTGPSGALAGDGLAQVPPNYDLAVELIRCRRLVKGYSDTHARGPVKV